MTEHDTIQTGKSLSPFTDFEIDWLLQDIKDRKNAWQPERCEVVQQIGAQLLYEKDRRANNADEANVHMEPRLIELHLDRIGPHHALVGLHVFNTRSKDNANDMPEAVGEFCDHMVDALIGVVAYWLLKAYPDRAAS